MADTKLNTTLTTTLSLLDRFTNSLNSLPTVDTTTPPNSPSPLPLLSTCAATLRAQTTKLSLLTITPPFTISAIATVLGSLNDAILPSLLTATLLLTPSNFTKAYSAEAISLTRATLRDLKDLAQLVESRSKDGKPKADPTIQQQNEVTAATGKIWEDCDQLRKLADDGIAGFVVKKAEQHLELIKDAVKELEEWDPEDDEDEDGFSDDQNAPAPPNDDHQKSSWPPNTEQPDQEIISVKSSALQVLTRLPQSLHVVIQQRLKRGLPPHPTRGQRLILDRLLTKMGQASTCIDDVAERLYTHDALGAILTAERARTLTVEIVEAVSEGWDAPSVGDMGAAAAAGEDTITTRQPSTKQDRYIARALAWIKNP